MGKIIEYNGKKYEEYAAWGETLSQVAQSLHNEFLNGKRFYCNFNGNIIYCDDTTDEIFIKVCDCTKAEQERKHEEYINKLKREDEEHKSKIPTLTEEWIEKGHKILNNKYWELWDKCVPARLNDLYQGMELGMCLQLVEMLNNGVSFDKVLDTFINQGHSGMSHGLLCSMLKSFCDLGEEFVAYDKSKY